MIDHAEAERRARSLAVQEGIGCEDLGNCETCDRHIRIIAAAIERAVQDTAEECASIALHHDDGCECNTGCGLEIYADIRILSRPARAPETHADQTEPDAGERLSGSKGGQ